MKSYLLLNLRDFLDFVSRRCCDTAFFIVLTLATLTVASSQTCKCLPGDSCFPSQPLWDKFAQNLSQPLISDQKPIGSVCYTSSPGYSASACIAANDSSSQSSFLSSHSNTLQNTNWEALITNNEVQQCVFDPSPNATCYQGRVPSYVINVTTVEDIQNTIRFASEHNLHLVVKNTG